MLEMSKCEPQLMSKSLSYKRAANLERKIKNANKIIKIWRELSDWLKLFRIIWNNLFQITSTDFIASNA